MADLALGQNYPLPIVPHDSARPDVATPRPDKKKLGI
jgi:hypothetical protein